MLQTSFHGESEGFKCFGLGIPARPILYSLEHRDRARMEMHKSLHMIGGEDEASYAKNSSLQRLVLRLVKPILEKDIEELLGDMVLPACIKAADLGCSSGPNTFFTAQNIIKSIDNACHMMNKEQPAIQFFLSDLVSNDFNTLFKGLPQFYEKMEKENGRRKGSCLIAAMPGSFYGKLFPDRSMHFLHSSYSLHWLSQVPLGLATESGIPMNKGSIYCGKTSPLKVHQAYLDQFTQDFTTFLKMRSQEMVQHGRLLLTFLCKDSEEVDGSDIIHLFGMALSDMVAEGHIEEERLDSFNLPLYKPSVQEAQQVIENEGSFKILSFQTFKTPLDAGFEFNVNQNDQRGDDDDPSLARARAKYVAAYHRAVSEPVLARNFGEGAIMDELFRRLTDKLVKIAHMGHGSLNNLLISLSKK